MKNILEEATGIIWNDREGTGGNPAHTLETIAELWRIYFEKKHNVLLAILPDDVATMMILLKIARLMRTPGHRDSLVDIAGYAGLIDKCDSIMGTPDEPNETWRQPVNQTALEALVPALSAPGVEGE